MSTNCPACGETKTDTFVAQPMDREYFNTRDPETDASLLFGTITRLEYQGLLSDPDNIDYRSIRNEVRRIVGWIVTPD